MADWTSLTSGLNATVLSAFGREVVYSPQTGQQVTVKAIFEETRETEENAPGVHAAVFLRASDLAAPPERGDEVVIDAAAYKVFDILADHVGGLILRLRRS
ncbi:MAG: hypothetical protein HY820_02185 [Acidobacteria bacterium]|nr:hypothetical protein [Acidobacteriota bacterium]